MNEDRITSVLWVFAAAFAVFTFATKGDEIAEGWRQASEERAAAAVTADG